ncbi:MAG: hypothetical protein Crog4KO_02040 [Crocinitomicaceae bacterium]
MRLLTYIVLALTIGVTSCKKGKADIVLKGTITDATFNSSLTGASVQLFEVEAGGGEVNLLGTTTIASDGSYSFTFPRNQVESYIVEVQKEGYYDIDGAISLQELSVEEDNVYNYSTTAKAWAGLHFVTSGNGTVTYTRQLGKSGCETCCESSTASLTGPIDTMIYCANDGNTTYSYTYNASGATGLKSVNTVAFDTSIVTLTF